MYTEQCFTFEETDKKGGSLCKKAGNAATFYSGARTDNTVLTIKCCEIIGAESSESHFSFFFEKTFLRQIFCVEHEHFRGKSRYILVQKHQIDYISETWSENKTNIY